MTLVALMINIGCKIVNETPLFKTKYMSNAGIDW